MDDDLIKRLQARCVYGDARLLMSSRHDPLSAEAAAEIYRLRAEIERLTKERDAQYEENVNRIAMQAKAEAERDEALAEIRDLKARNAVQSRNIKMLLRNIDSDLADAERDMRQRAADVCDRNDQVSGWVSRDAILALPLKHADREGEE